MMKSFKIYNSKVETKVNVGRFLGESIGKILMKLKEANFYGRIFEYCEINRDLRVTNPISIVFGMTIQ